MFEKPKVYFHIDELSRDAVVASALKRYLQPRGIDVIYGNRETSDSFLHVNFPFDLAIFPGVDYLPGYFGDPGRVTFPVIVLPTESIHLGQATRSRLLLHLLGDRAHSDGPSLWADRVSKFCLWGPAHRDAIVEKAPELAARLTVVGHPRHDRACLPTRAPRRTGSARIGVVTRADLINDFLQRSNLSRIEAERIGKQEGLDYFQHDGFDVEERWYCSVYDAKWAMNAVDLMVRDGFQVSLRVHPREDKSSWSSVIASMGHEVEIADWRIPFTHWASDQNLIIAPPSTSAYDCVLLNVPVALTSHLDPRRMQSASPNSDDFDPLLKHLWLPQSSDHLQEMAQTASSATFGLSPLSDEAMAILSQEVGYPYQSTSMLQVADMVDALLEQKPKADAPFDVGLRRAKFSIIRLLKNLRASLRGLFGGSVPQSSSFAMTRAEVGRIDALTGAVSLRPPQADDANLRREDEV